MNTRKLYEAIIIGGSSAGLSAAMALGRSVRKVLIIDSGFPANRIWYSRLYGDYVSEGFSVKNRALILKWTYWFDV
jgi:thioredoxin reductase